MCRQSPLEREALEFINNLQNAYLERRDLQAVLNGMEHDISWLGTGEFEICNNYSDAEVSLSREFEEYPGRFLIKSSEFRVRELSDNICVVYGTLCASSESPEMADLENRISAVCIKTPGGMKLLHLHCSRPDSNQEEGHYYVRRAAALDRKALQMRVAEAVRALKERDHELSILSDNIPGGIHQCRNDRALTLINVSNGFLSLVGYSRDELRKRFNDSLAALIHPDDRENVISSIKEQLSRGNMVELEYRVCRKDGEILWLLDKSRLETLSDGTQTFYCMLLDDTARRNEREALRLSLERHKIIMDQATDIIFEWDIKKDTLSFSSNWRKKFGYEAIKSDISRNIPFSENIHPDDMSAFIKIMEDTAAGAPYSETEFRIRDVLGAFTWCRIRATAQYDDRGRPIKAVGVIVDIDADKKQRERLLEQAQRDGLTGLYNKSAARHEIERSFKEARESRGVMLIIDLDDFKGINDRYGHLTGDAVLSDAAAILKRLFRSADVVARIGGDEFLAYMPGAPAEEAERRAAEIIGAMDQLPVYGHKGRVSCSVGAAVFPNDSQGFHELYRCADLALYKVKNSGKKGFAFYTPSLRASGPDGDVIRSAVNVVIDSDAGIVNATLGQYCFRMLYRAIEPVTAVHQILEIVGRAYDVSRVYIFESSEDGLHCSNTFEWCNDGVPPEIDRLQNLSYHDDLDDYMNNFNKEGVFYCGDVRKLGPSLQAILVPQGIRSMLQCAIVDDGKFTGYVGFDECRENRRWTQAQIETLILVANVLSTFLMKLRLKERLNRLKDA